MLYSTSLVEIDQISSKTFDEQTYLSASAQRAGALAETVVSGAQRGLQWTHQAVQVIKAPICRQLFQGGQGAGDINVIIDLSEGLNWNKGRLC